MKAKRKRQPATKTSTLYSEYEEKMITSEYRASFSEGRGLKGPSHDYDNPKPGDLGLGRMKSGESLMEVRRGADVQIAPLTWA